MALEKIEINSVSIIFDKEKTKGHRTEYNKPCDCQDCRNYYKHIQNNSELVEFLNIFGADYNNTDEVMSWELENKNDSLIHYESYYGVFGKIDGEDFNFEKFGVKISFSKGAPAPSDRSGDYFWICIEADLPYLLDEDRISSVPFFDTKGKISIVKKIKTFFDKKYCLHTSLSKKELICILKELIDPEMDEHFFCGEVSKDEFCIMKHKLFSNNVLNPCLKGNFVETDSGTNLQISAKFNKKDRIGLLLFFVASLCIVLFLLIYGIISKTYNFIGPIIALVCFELFWYCIGYIIFSLKVKSAVSKLEKYINKEHTAG